MKLQFTSLILFITTIFWGCVHEQHPQNNSDLDALLKFHQQQQDAHLNYDAGLFVAMFNDPIIQIKRGAISRTNRQQNLDRLQSYFGNVKFIEWADIDPPIIRISGDCTMAYIIVNKRVRLTYEDEQGRAQEDHTVFAWLETWEKIDGHWKIMAVASTDKDGK